MMDDGVLCLKGFEIQLPTGKGRVRESQKLRKIKLGIYCGQCLTCSNANEKNALHFWPSKTQGIKLLVCNIHVACFTVCRLLF